MIKVKVFEGDWYRVNKGDNMSIGVCDFTYCVYVFGILVYTKFYNEVSFIRSRVLFEGCEVVDVYGNSKKY